MHLCYHQRPFPPLCLAHLESQDTENYWESVDAYSDLVQYERATEDYDEAIRLKPDISSSYFSRGLAYQKLGKHKESERDYQKAKELGP